MHLSKLWHEEKGSLGRDYSPRNVRPFSSYTGNTTEIPYALFVPPFYQQGLPRSLNYGGIGGTIAHELAAQFLADNRRRWNRTDRRLFTNRTSCFEKQYKPVNRKLLLELDDNYNENTSAEATKNQSLPSGKTNETDDDCLRYWEEYDKKREHYQSKQLRIHWRRTLNEDIADNIGLQTAFEAYRRVLEEECQGIDTRLKGLENVTGLQLFFISEARVQCRIADNATLIQELRWEKFSPAPNRVNMAMKNFEEFARAFNCSHGSPLYPPKNETCSLW
nr:neprilysin-1-like [Dermacentor andersoni]